MFLHGSFAHLCTNMLGIFILGPAVESRFGRLRLLFIYMISGIGSLYLVMHLTLLGYLDESLLVGASGAIMGLIGALAAPLILQSIRSGSLSSNQQLRSILMILAIQIVFDLSTPQVSSPAHLGGFFTGLIFGFVLRSK